MGKGKKKRSYPPRDRSRVGLCRYQEEQLKEKLRRCTPSEPWVEEQIVNVADVDADGNRIHYCYYNPKGFPPGGEKTLMVRCRICGTYTPPHAMEQGMCLDHAIPKGRGRSPSAQAFRKAARLNFREEFKNDLAPEDTASLLREIEQYLQEHPEERKCGAEM
jgi:hypothetical protein